MKKLFTLLMLMVCAVGMVGAQTFTIKAKTNGKQDCTQTRTDGQTGDFFTIEYGAQNNNKKYACTYNNEVYSTAFKVIEGKGCYISFTPSKDATVTVVQSIAESKTAANTIKVGEKSYTAAEGTENPNTGDVDVRVYTFIATANTLCKITSANKKEIGIALVKVEYPQKEVESEIIEKVTINGTDKITDVTDLTNNENHTLTYSKQYSVTPTVVFTTKKTYKDGSTEPGTYDAVVTSDGTNFTATATINGIEYTIIMGISKEPVLQSDVKSINVRSGKVTPLATKDITITGNNLSGEASISFPTVDGLSISPSTIDVVDGKVDAKLTVSYTSLEEVAETSAEMSISVGETKLNIPITYSSSAASTNIKPVSEATTWDFSKTGVTSEINLNSEGNPTTVDEFILSDATEYIKADATFDAEAIAVGAVARFAKTYFQGKVIKIKTTVPGKIQVKFSDTGKNPPAGETTRKYRKVVVNGVSSSTTSNTSEKSEITEGIEVAAGEITINGAYVEDGSIQPLRFYSLTFTPLEAPASITLNSYGYNTYSNANTVTVTGAVAYTCTVNNETKKVVLKELGTVVPAGQGVLLKGEANGTVSFAFGGEEPVIAQNDFQPVLKAVATPADKAIYVLYGNQFKKYTGATLVANKAYIELGAGTAAAALSIEWDGGTTGIGGIEESVVDDNVPVYNLNGQRIDMNTKGIIIKNGKKIINK